MAGALGGLGGYALFGNGGGGISTEEPRIGTMRIQTSAYGGTVKQVYGTARLTGNLVWYGDFTATPHTTTQSVGGIFGFGGSDSSSTTYTYSASTIMALCAGEISEIPIIWRDKEKFVGETIPPEIITVNEEIHRVPDSLKLEIKFPCFVDLMLGVENEAEYVLPWRRIDTPNGLLEQGCYRVTADGVYTFSPEDAGAHVWISYQYTRAAYYLSAADKLNLTLFKGAIGQEIWSYLQGKHPKQAIPYSGMAYVAGANYDLDNSASLKNHSFEVVTPFAFSASIPDANPAAILQHFLTDPVHGAGLTAENLHNLQTYSDYCVAAGLFLSPVLTSQEAAQSTVSRLMQATNSEVVWSEGLLKVIPYGDEALSGNGASYSPTMNPRYDLNDDDFIGNQDPVVCKRATSADAYNQVQVEYLDRTTDYNTAIAEAKDQANIEAYGLRAMSAVTLHDICDSAVARQVAQLIMQRALYVRNTYEFKLGWRHCLLEPMDLVTLTDAGLGLNKLPVRIVEIEEDDSGLLSVIAEDWPFGIAGATQYPHQHSEAFSLDTNASVGPCATPVIFEPMPRLASGKQEMWIAAAGSDPLWGGAHIWLSLDGSSYKQIGTLTSPARYGVSTTALSVGASPDKSGELGVDLSRSHGRLIGGSQTEADCYATLCWLGGEFIAFRDATLTDTDQYTLRYLLRNGYDSPMREHSVGTPFVRIDEALFKWEFPDELIGQQISVKLTSFNAFGGGEEDLSAAMAYSYTLQGKAKLGQSATTSGGGNATSDDSISISYDSAGYVILTFRKLEDPAIKSWELRIGDTGFETGTLLDMTDENYFRIPLTRLLGQQIWIKALYTNGSYSALTYKTAFSGASLPAISQITSRIVEPQIEFAWPAVPGADRYVTYFEEGGITTTRVLAVPTLLVGIPKYASLLRVYAVNTSGQTSAPYEQSVAVSGAYHLNELVNIPLNMSTGQYLNMAFTNANQVEKVSLLGPASFSTPLSNPNNAGLYSFGYNLLNTPGSALQNTPGTWFRQNFWYDGDGFFESAPVDLGQLLSGRLKLQISKTVTAYGSGAGNAFAHVSGEYMAQASGLDLTDTKAFLSATFYVAPSMAGPWIEAGDGDWVESCRFVKIVVKAEHISPLTDCLVTAGALTLDVPDLTENGTKTAVTSAGISVPLSKSFHQISLVLLTPRGNCKAWASNVVASSGSASFTINTDSASPVDIGYFVKGF